MNKPYNGWENINWTRVRCNVLKWQQEVYLASSLGNVRKVRLWQHKILSSFDARLLAVRQVTQDNKGKVTAGVDGLKKLPPSKRFTLAGQLKFPTKAKPLRRVWIPKPPTKEKRPLGIPTIQDRCLQALFKLALEPEWEAKFEPNSYGFRPGRNCHDAIKAILDSTIKGSKYVLDADISKCFDKINHDYLLNKISLKGAMRKQINYWLKSGVLDSTVFSETKQGTPQGAVISPLLANIALHGIEFHLKEWISNKPIYSRTGEPVRKSRRSESIHIIRYAADFVILHQDKNIVLESKNEIIKFLTPIGLELSAAKTRVTHTLDLKPGDNSSEGLEVETGFNFLGFTIKQFKSRSRSMKSTTGKLLGYKTLVYPSQKSVNQYQNKLHDIILKDGKALGHTALIKKLNPIIRGWASYFGVSHANTTGHLGQQDYLLYLKLRQWAKRKTGTSGKGAQFWSRLGSRKWVFSNKEAILLENIAYSKPISSYVKVKGSSSPYSPDDSIYWAKRNANYPGYNIRVKKLLTKQKGFCKWCRLQFWSDEAIEVDHIVPLSRGGKDQYSNLQLLHRHCHDLKTVRDNLTKLQNS